MNAIPGKNKLLEVIKGALTTEQLQNAAVYVYKHILQPLKKYRFGRTDIHTNYEAVLLFADIEPGANWSHAAMYLIYNNENTQKTETSFPPSPEDWLLVCEPEHSKNWMLITTNRYLDIGNP